MPTYLELKGALSLVRTAKKNLRMSGWEGTKYHEATQAEKEAWDILYKSELSLCLDIKAMLGQNKEFTQAAVLGGI